MRGQNESLRPALPPEALQQLTAGVLADLQPLLDVVGRTDSMGRPPPPTPRTDTHHGQVGAAMEVEGGPLFQKFPPCCGQSAVE